MRVEAHTAGRRQYCGRSVAKKPFFVFFKLNSDFANKYDIVYETKLERAENAAREKYGARVNSVLKENDGTIRVTVYKFERIGQ